MQCTGHLELDRCNKKKWYNQNENGRQLLRHWAPAITTLRRAVRQMKGLMRYNCTVEAGHAFQKYNWGDATLEARQDARPICSSASTIVQVTGFIISLLDKYVDEKNSPYDLDLNICCQDHDSEWSSTGFSRRSLFIKKLLTKEVHI